MSFRRRLLLASAAAVAAAVVLAAVLAYVLVRGNLRGQVDDSLKRTAVTVGTRPTLGAAPEQIGLSVGSAALQGKPAVYTQIFEGGTPPAPGQRFRLSSAADLDAVASGRRPPHFSDTKVDGSPVRVYIAPLPGGGAIQVARSLTEVDTVLSRLRLGLGGVIAAGVAIALLLGWLATRAAAKPVARLTETAEHVARTRDLSQRIAVDGDDELSRLAVSFNTMLEALDSSRRAQRRLVADASHELRTPLTSLRTNLEVLGRSGDGLGDADRERLRADVVVQIEELIGLVADLVDLAREEEPAAEHAEVRFDELVCAAIARARRHAPGVEFHAELEPTIVSAATGRLDRAVANLLDNAAKWSPPGGTVEVTLAGGELAVRDRGPGIAEADLPYVFDRFYRAAGARGRPGSGLGLAIVRQVAEAHGGSVEAAAADGGGALLRLRLPALPAALSSSPS